MKNHRTKFRAWEDETPRDTIDWSRITPRSGSLGIEEQPAQKSAPVITPLGDSRQLRAFVITCEICRWESQQESSVTACEIRLLAHTRLVHPHKGDAIDVRIRSRKFKFPIEVIDL